MAKYSVLLNLAATKLLHSPSDETKANTEK